MRGYVPMRPIYESKPALVFKYRGHRFVHLRGGNDVGEADAGVRIRAKIASGVLPLPPEAPEKCFVGKGTRRPCNGCDKVISPDEIEYEIDVVDGRTLRFHAKCLDAWHQARAERMAE